MAGSDNGVVAWNVKRIGHLDIPGGGQVVVQGRTAYVGHIDPPHGTSIVDVSDLAKPKILSTLEMPPDNHSHKVRVSGDIMLINNEAYRRHQMWAGTKLPAAKAKLEKDLGRAPTEAELAAALNYRPEDIPALLKAATERYDSGGLRIYDVSDPRKPREISFFKTADIGVHRFDFDGRYAYISTRMEGYHGNIVVIVDLRNPAKPEEVSRWWLPGQWIAGGEEPCWGDARWECHHPLRFGNRLYVSYHWAGIIILDISDITKPRMISHYNYHPPVVCSTHTYARVPFRLAGKDVAVVTDEEPGRARPGHIPGFMWLFDVTDETNPKPLSAYFMSEEDTPWKRAEHGGRFGAHQCHERTTDSLVYVTWFRGGLRIVDIADPAKPKEAGCFIPTPGKGQKTVQSNDVFVDDRGMIYLVDRLNGLDILEYKGPAGQRPGL
ncbi:MAG: sigma-70 domain-containing protein [Candidatus Binatia bacterium]